MNAITLFSRVDQYLEGNQPNVVACAEFLGQEIEIRNDLMGTPYLVKNGFEGYIYLTSLVHQVLNVPNNLNYDLPLPSRKAGEKLIGRIERWTVESKSKLPLIKQLFQFCINKFSKLNPLDAPIRNSYSYFCKGDQFLQNLLPNAQVRIVVGVRDLLHVDLKYVQEPNLA